MQFVCGYYDVDLRDSTGLGHGRLIAEHASPAVRDQWVPRLLNGAVPGIAITEAHGGSQVHATRTRAALSRDGTWTVTGMKTWISRLAEAAVFCLFFAGPDGKISAAVVDARSEGLTRVPFVPAGLSGWTWGELHLDQVQVRPDDIIGQPGAGMRLLREHFAGYRPLVTATALGAAAGCHDRTAATLEARRRSGSITGLRDNALITIGRSYAEINAAVLAACTAPLLASQRMRPGFHRRGWPRSQPAERKRLYATGLPFSSVATVPVSHASRQAVIRRASSGVTRSAASYAVTNSNPDSSPSTSTIPLTSSGDRTPPSNTMITPSGSSVRSGPIVRAGTQSTASTRPGARSRPSSSATSRRHAAFGDSSASTAPPGNSQGSL
jgi:hypothetical protein